MTAIFLLCVAFCAYTLAGYPLLLGLMARLRPRPVRKAPWQAAVSIILPVANGERWMAAKLECIRELDYPAELMEVLVVSDGSTDGTETVVREFMSREFAVGECPRIRFLAVPKGGKASALNAALAQATGEILFFTDVRQELHRSCLANLVDCFADPAVGVASGELVIRQGQQHRVAKRCARHRSQRGAHASGGSGRNDKGHDRSWDDDQDNCDQKKGREKLEIHLAKLRLRILNLKGPSRTGRL